MVRIYNHLLNLKSQQISPNQGDDLYFYRMGPVLGFEFSDFEFDYDGLYFLIEFGYPNVLGELPVVESKFRNFALAVSKHSEIHENEAQKAMESSEVEEGNVPTEEQIRSILDDTVFYSLRGLADQIIWNAEDLIANIERVVPEFRSAVSDVYPNAKLIDFSLEKS